MEVQSIDFGKMNATLDALLASMNEAEEPGTAGEGEATNENDTLEAVDKYMTGIADALLASYEMSEDDAYGFILDVADSMSELGLLPELPDSEDAPVEEYALWLGKAGTIKFDAMVMQAATKQMG